MIVRDVLVMNLGHGPHPTFPAPVDTHVIHGDVGL
jgi:hypothetical protein